MSTPRDVLRRLIAQSIAVHEAVASRLGINATDLRSLELAASEPEMTPTRLAELNGLTTGAVTGIIDRLERGGFVRREADPADRRRILVRVVPERMADMAAAYEPVLARASAIDDGLARHLAAFADALESEAARLRAVTHGGMVGDTYLAPRGEARRARLVLATGAPRVNIGGAALGQQVRMVAETAATRLSLRTGDPSDELIVAGFVGPPPDMRTADGTVTMRYRRRMLDTRSREIDARLNPSLPWSVEIEGGITDLDADLRAVSFGGLDLRGGVNHLKLLLPRPDGTVRIILEGGSSDARVTRPVDVPIALSVRGGVSRLRFDARKVDASGTDLRLESSGFATAPDRYELEVAGGISELRVAEE
jgi:DNA-binding MarR family transcriptional regulator